MTKIFYTASVVAALAMTGATAHAESRTFDTPLSSPAAPSARPTAGVASDAADDADPKKGLGDFAGLKFGVGISFTLDTGDNDRVSDASVVNGIVRVNDEDNGRARVMLESHYFFTPGVKPENYEKARWGVGPFVSLQPGSDNIIEAIGMGLMFGFRRGNTNDSFNIGLGMVIDPNTRILGNGIVADTPLPTGETEVRYKEEMQRGLLILTSFSF